MSKFETMITILFSLHLFFELGIAATLTKIVDAILYTKKEAEK